MSNLVIVLAIFIFVIGTILGSFVNVLTFRFRKKNWLSMIIGRSQCPECKHLLGWHDMIPILSFIYLRRKCRYCKGRIAWQYPIVEFVGGLIAVALFFQFGLSWALLLYGLIFMLLLALFIIDLVHGLLPDILLAPLTVLALAALALTAFLPDQFAFDLVGRFSLQPLLGLFGSSAYGGPTSITSLNVLIYNLGGAVFAAAFFGLQILISRGKWTGMGDLKMGAVLGLLIGWPLAVLWLFFSYVLGGIAGIFLLARRKKKLHETIPFGPFLIIGALITFFWGATIWNWYLGLFL